MRTRSPTRAPTHSLTHSHTRTLTHLFTHSPTRPSTYPLSPPSPTHSLAHFTHTHTLTHTLTHSPLFRPLTRPLNSHTHTHTLLQVPACLVKIHSQIFPDLPDNFFTVHMDLAKHKYVTPGPVARRVGFCCAHASTPPRLHASTPPHASTLVSSRPYTTPERCGSDFVPMLNLTFTPHYSLSSSRHSNLKLLDDYTDAALKGPAEEPELDGHCGFLETSRDISRRLGYLSPVRSLGHFWGPLRAGFLDPHHPSHATLPTFALAIPTGAIGC